MLPIEKNYMAYPRSLYIVWTPLMIWPDEPKYADPSFGAPLALQHRIAEISSLELETVRWEKSRKIRKKTSKDS